MAELTLFVNSTDSALLNGSAISPAAANGVAADASMAGGFSGVLSKQLSPKEGEASAESAQPTNDVRSVSVAQTGEPRPLNGKALPPADSQVVKQGTQTESLLPDTSLLSAIAQDISVENVPPLAATPLLAPALARLNGALQSILPPLATTQSTGQNTTSAQPVDNRAALPGLLNPAANPQTLTTAIQNTPPVLPNANEDVQRAAASPLVPSLLGKSLSVTQQQALERAALNSGKANFLRADMISASGVTTSNAQPNNIQASALSGVNNPMGSTLRMDLFNAAIGAATQAGDEFRLPTNIAATPQSVSAAVTNITPDGAFILPADMSRLPGTVGNIFSPTLAVSTPVGQPAWASELGQRVTWLANNELREAKLQLNPRSLGAVDVRISYGPEQQLNVSFSTANPVARDALDASLPRLREMFEQQGLQLADANISHESPKEREHRNSMGSGSQTQGIVSAEDDELSHVTGLNPPPSQWMSEGMLDAYA